MNPATGERRGATSLPDLIFPHNKPYFQYRLREPRERDAQT